MSTAPVKTLIDEQLDDIQRRIAIIGYGMPFNEVIGRSRDERVADLPLRLTATMQGRRIAVRVRPR
ncbi:hypothetical protein G7W60_06115 [Pseudomonas fluorescens]|jgi:hypothetical protein|uniref:hypothetical protein n=1 Tax=Pseudomonas fluorescens TaxID=294 RepID=UPI001404B890|nr:hypothetical protein [Pseudomonas fluorescens]NHN67406.1 hypothetical protein [Pseudomonas fluorescens]